MSLSHHQKQQHVHFRRTQNAAVIFADDKTNRQKFHIFVLRLNLQACFFFVCVETLVL